MPPVTTCESYCQAQKSLKTSYCQTKSLPNTPRKKTIKIQPNIVVRIKQPEAPNLLVRINQPAAPNVLIRNYPPEPPNLLIQNKI
jgi:thiamine kinase-like enzyme